MHETGGISWSRIEQSSWKVDGRLIGAISAGYFRIWALKSWILLLERGIESIIRYLEN